MSSPDDIITLESKDGQTFEVTRKIISKCEVVRTMLEHLGEAATDNPVPFSEISGPILELIVKWLNHHAEDPEVAANAIEDPVLSDWDKNFMEFGQTTLFEMINATNYLNLEPLLDMCCRKVAGIIKGKSVEELRKTFDIKNDFTPEEEQQIRQENAWCEED